MKKFKTVDKSRSDIMGQKTVFTRFTVSPIDGAENAWIARIEQTEHFSDSAKQTIIEECFDCDILMAMKKCQVQLFSTGLGVSVPSELRDDPTDLLWGEIVTELEKQFGFCLA
jgi:hypothetical protein